MYFFVELEQKKRKLKNHFWAPEFGCPNQYTGLPNGLDTSLLTLTVALTLTLRGGGVQKCNSTHKHNYIATYIYIYIP